MTHPVKLLNNMNSCLTTPCCKPRGKLPAAEWKIGHGKGVKQVGAVRLDQPGKPPRTGPFSQIMF